tara:strand:+ start:1091 stop:1489 length:399 start_codon:yes stop_codon:yes gene_type:complete
MKQIHTTQAPAYRLNVAPNVFPRNEVLIHNRPCIDPVTEERKQIGPIHPRAVVRGGEWIATHLDHFIETFGRVGGEGTELPLRFGNVLQKGDIIVPLREGAAYNTRMFTTVIDNELLRVYRRNGTQPGIGGR